MEHHEGSERLRAAWRVGGGNFAEHPQATAAVGRGSRAM
jgi:hypothetical protein